MVSRTDANNFAYALGIPEPSDLLEEAIVWIGSNMSPEDVFSKKDLESWAENNRYARED